MWAETTETLGRSDLQKCQEKEKRNYCLGKQIILCFGMNLKGLMFVLSLHDLKIYILPSQCWWEEKKRNFFFVIYM